MKFRRMGQLCYENDLTEFDLMIDFIKRITEKKEITYQNYEFDIEEDDFMKLLKMLLKRAKKIRRKNKQ